jgi:hypothetical protein
MIKYQELLQKRDKIKERLTGKMLRYRGVSHENSLSEIKDQEVKVLKAHLETIEKELLELSRS